MTPEQAIAILREVTPGLRVPLETHMAVQQAIGVLEAVTAAPAPTDPAVVEHYPEQK